MSLSHPRKPHGLGAALSIAVFALAAGLLGGFASGFLQSLPQPWGLTLIVALLVLTMAATFAVMVWWWRGIDEAAREAHKWAWWWGGSVGIAIGGVVLLVAGMYGDLFPWPLPTGPGPGELIGAGMVAMLMLQMTGYVLAWAFWWLRNR